MFRTIIFKTKEKHIDFSTKSCFLNISQTPAKHFAKYCKPLHLMRAYNADITHFLFLVFLVILQYRSRPT